LTPLSPTNPKFAIPGQYPTINSIDVVGSWGSDSDLGTGYTVDPSTSIEIVEQDGWVCGSDVYSERFPLINGEAALPYWQYGSHPITAAVGNLGEQIVLPQGALIRNIFLIVKDSNGVRSNSIVSEMAVKKSDGTNLWGPFNFSSAQKNKADNLYMTSLPGCYLFQLGEDIAGSDVSVEGGIVLKNTQTLRCSLQLLVLVLLSIFLICSSNAKSNNLVPISYFKCRSRDLPLRHFLCI